MIWLWGDAGDEVPRHRFLFDDETERVVVEQQAHDGKWKALPPREDGYSRQVTKAAIDGLKYTGMTLHHLSKTGALALAAADRVHFAMADYGGELKALYGIGGDSKQARDVLSPKQIRTLAVCALEALAHRSGFTPGGPGHRAFINEVADKAQAGTSIISKEVMAADEFPGTQPP